MEKNSKFKILILFSYSPPPPPCNFKFCQIKSDRKSGRDRQEKWSFLSSAMAIFYFFLFLKDWLRNKKGFSFWTGPDEWRYAKKGKEKRRATGRYWLNYTDISPWANMIVIGFMSDFIDSFDAACWSGCAKMPLRSPQRLVTDFPRLALESSRRTVL